MDVSKLSDEELLEIIVRDENSNTPDSLHQKATIEYAIRNKRKEQEHQSELLSVAQFGIKRIIELLEFIIKKPKLAVFYTALLAIVIGVAVNVISELIIKLLR